MPPSHPQPDVPNVSALTPQTHHTLEHVHGTRSEVLLRRSEAPVKGGRVVLILLGIAVAAMFLPWQQNIRGNGRVTALRPQDRPQQVISTIAGRVEQWYVAEGQFVKAGDPLVRLTEVKADYLDPEILQRTSNQVVAKQSELIAKDAKAEAYANQIRTLHEALRLKLQQGRLKVQIDSVDLIAARTNYAIAQRQLEGQQALFDKGLKSLVDLENRRLKLQETLAKMQSAEAKLLQSRVDLNSIQAEYMKDIAKAESERQATLAEVNEGQGSLLKLQSEVAKLQTRQGLYVLRAPQTGYVVKALKQGLGEQVKEQEPIVTIMPRDPSQAVELYVSANDVPLLQRGFPVRLQFDGWPALQFSGWPSIAVGTFGGRIQVVDYTASSNGLYRVLVVPDSTEREQWPDIHKLRQGSGVYGWALLNEVPVWYEIWRQLNGFPPALPGVPVVPNDEAEYGKGKDNEKVATK